MSNGLSICAIFELSKLQGICTKVFGKWNWTSNTKYCQKGTRIILGWNPKKVDVMVLSQNDQVIHCQIKIIDENKHLFYSFIYAGNNPMHRKQLWKSLCAFKRIVAARSWDILGDFNVALNIEDHSTGSSGITLPMREFRDCIEKIEVEDVNRVGLHYMWNQRPNSNLGIFKKIDHYGKWLFHI